MKVLQPLLLLLAASVGCSAVQFGTNTGYDNEGETGAMCWKVQPEFPFEISSVLESLVVTELRSSIVTNTSVELLEDCYKGLALNVTLEENSAGKGRSVLLHSDTEVTFRFDMTLDPSEVEEGLALVPAQQVVARITFCDASRTGLCVPFKLNSDELGESLLAGEESEPQQGKDNPKKPKTSVSSQMHSSVFDEDIQDGVTTLSLSGIMKVNVPSIVGSYYVIGHCILFFGDNSTNTNIGTFEVSISNAVAPRVFTIKNAPTLLEPTQAYKIGISVLLGVAALFEAILLVGVVTFRKNMVLKLSQPPFLVLLVFCSLVATVSCTFYIPENDLYCKLWSPLILIPVNMIASILIARGWRMYVILSSSLRISLISSKRRVVEERFMATLTFLASWQELLGNITPIHRFGKSPSTAKRQTSSMHQKSLRKEVKDHHVLQLIVSLTIPQVTIQSIALTKYPAQVEVLESESFSRVACQNDHWWPTLISIILVIILFLMAVFVAYICRDLPSLFNEKVQIFKASWINFIVLVFAGIMVGLTDSETTSPNSRAFLWTSITLCVSLTPCFCVVLPKIKRAQKGEMVVLSRLFASPSLSLGGAPSGALTTTAPQHGSGSIPLGNSSDDVVPSHVDPLKQGPLPKIVVHANDPPPRHLELQLFAMKDLIANVSDSSTEGRRISKHEWQLLQNSTLALSNHLQQLEFDWEEQEDDEILRREHAVAHESIAEVFSAVGH